MGRMRALRCASSIALLGLSALSSKAHAQAPAPSPTAPAAPPPADASLSTGGLAPPPALESNPDSGGAPATPAATEAELAKADREDSGRGLEFVWLNAEAGVMHLGLGTFKNDKIVDPSQVSTTQTGLVVGAGAGVRLVFITLGARFRYAPLPDAKLWTLGAEAGLHAQLGALEPYGALGLGYVSIGSLAGNSEGATLRGFDARLSGGLDYYFTNMFSLGVNVGAELLLLARNGSCTQALAAATGGPSVYCSDGSSTGGAVTATAVAGLHF
jgi:hypothetical protein